MLRRVTIMVLALCITAHAEDRKKAEQYFRLGEKAYQAQNFEAAAANFEAAYKEFDLPEIAFSAAQAYRRQYRVEPKPELVARAVELYQFYLSKVKTGGRVADAADALGEMQHELDKLIASGVKVSPTLAAEHTMILINPSLGSDASTRGVQEVEDRAVVSGSKIIAKLDGKVVEPFAPINVPPGMHRVSVEADGYFPIDKQENVPQGATVIADIELTPRSAKVTLTTEQGARISVDGRLAGTAPLPALEMPAGHHVITILHRGREPVVRELTVTRGQEVAMREPLDFTARRRAVPWLLAGAGFGVLVTATSIVLAFHEDRAAASINYDIMTLGNLDPDVIGEYNVHIARRREYTYGSLTSGALTLGVAAVGIVLYYTDTPSAEGARVQPMISKDGAGAVWSGRF